MLSARSKAGKAFKVLALYCAGDSGIFSNIRTSCSEKREVTGLLRQCSGIRVNSNVSAQSLKGFIAQAIWVGAWSAWAREELWRRQLSPPLWFRAEWSRRKYWAPELSMPSLGSQEP